MRSKKTHIGFLIALILLTSCNSSSPQVLDSQDLSERDIPIFSEDDPVLGNRDAPIQMVVFFDAQCPFCRQFHQTIQQIEDEWVSSGKLVIQYRDYPLSKHRFADNTHRALFAAHQQSQHNLYLINLFAEQSLWTQSINIDEYLIQTAEKLGLNKSTFLMDYTSTAAGKEILLDKVVGQEFGIREIPSTLINDKLYRGALSLSQLKKILEAFSK
ncbi:MAG: thioredoxin domain-containing protein [Candidatus Gracilibacteria bacterium]|nr:thioredoxin domain-containing protein [Candidatus Gracilibacteria bacterium]